MTAHDLSASCRSFSSSILVVTLRTSEACSGVPPSIPRRPLGLFFAIMRLSSGCNARPKGVSRTVCGRLTIFSGIPLPRRKVERSLEKLLQLCEKRS